MTVAADKQRNGHKRDLVGFAGLARSGKDTAAGVLVEHGWTRLAFADEIKAMALDLDPIVDEWGGPIRLSTVVAKHGWENAKNLPEIRRTLQRLGTECVRARDPEFWVRVAMARALQSDTPVVFTDVRFANEAAAIQAAGGHVVHIIRDNGPTLDELAAGHASECIDFDCDRLLVNDGDLAQLRARVLALVHAHA